MTPQPTIDGRTWFQIDGTLEAIDFDGPSYFRFPYELARIVIGRLSEPGDMVIDPFCGFGTALVAAEDLDRRAVGIEKDADRFGFASERVHEPNRVIHASALDLDTLELPPADLIFTSPPYTSFRDWDQAGFDTYWTDFDAVFAKLSGVLRADGRLVVEVSNVREEDGRVRQVAFEAALRLGKWYEFLGEIVRCNTGAEKAGPGVDHAYLMVFRLRASHD